MKKAFNPEVLMQNLGPEVKSFIYQTILDFEPFSTPETVISVVAKNPLELLSQVDDEAGNVTHAFDLSSLPKKTTLKKMYRIAISLTEQDQKIEAEAIHENIYDAIRLAKEHLVETLTKIQDDVISNQDRHMQIRHAMASGGEVH